MKDWCHSIVGHLPSTDKPVVCVPSTGWECREEEDSLGHTREGSDVITGSSKADCSKSSLLLGLRVKSKRDRISVLINS